MLKVKTETWVGVGWRPPSKLHVQALQLDMCLRNFLYMSVKNLRTTTDLDVLY